MDIGKYAVAALALTACMLVAGCSVNVNKDSGGEDKDVSIHTPFGGMQVHKNTADAAAMGLPVYPGAVLRASHDDHDKSVDLTMGFGRWQMHVQVANYVSSDPQAKVQDFYRKALGAYGQVLTCRGNQPVGQPVKTSEGLTCSDDHRDVKMAHVGNDQDLELKAGSHRHQRLVAFKNEGDAQTDFALVTLTLPPHGGSTDQSGEE